MDVTSGALDSPSEEADPAAPHPPGELRTFELPERLQIVRDQIRQNALFEAVFQSVPECALLLNENRQVIEANAAASRAFGLESDQAIGKRPGDLMGCAHVQEGTHGCGTGPHCLVCGAGQALNECLIRRVGATRECRVTTRSQGIAALDLEIHATPFDFQGRRLTICMIRDISAEKRRRVYERFFFHEVINIAGGLGGLLETLEDENPDPEWEAEALRLMGVSVDRLVAEVQRHRELTAAEADDLPIHSQEVLAREILRAVVDDGNRLDMAVDREIDLVLGEDFSLTTDPRLLRHVLDRMVENALEATGKGGRIEVRATLEGESAIFSVHSAAPMPRVVQLQVFKRSFSTKSAQGRGVGTHAMKLIGENVLGGHVGFQSGPADGTTFWIRLPRQGAAV